MTNSMGLTFLQEPLGWLKLHQEKYPDLAWEGYYLRIMIAYLSCDIKTLTRLSKASQIRSLKAHADEILFVQLASALRLKIRTETLSTEDLTQCSTQMTILKSPAFQGELQFLIAIGYEVLNLDLEAKQFYLKASENFDQAQLHRKAVKSLYNSLAAQTRIEPDHSYLNSHYLLFQKAKKNKDLITAGLALTSSARELHKLGCYHFSVKYSKKALTYLTADIETLHYQMAVLNLCHTLCELKKFSEANEYYLLIKDSSFSEIKSALLALENLFTNSKHAPQKLVPTWLERLAQKDTMAPVLSEHEQQLIFELSKKPQTKHELLKSLYGENLEFETKDNRFRNLLVRINKKHKDMILKDHTKYYLAGGQ